MTDAVVPFMTDSLVYSSLVAVCDEVSAQIFHLSLEESAGQTESSVFAFPDTFGQTRLEDLRQQLNLSDFEAGVVTLCAAMEFFPERMLAACATALQAESSYSAFLAPTLLRRWLGAYTTTTDVTAFQAEGNLTRFHLIECGQSANSSVVEALMPVRITAGLLIYLQGDDGLPSELRGVAQALPASALLSGSQQALLVQAAKHLSRGAADRGVMLYGQHAEDMRALAGHLLSASGSAVHLDVAALAARSAEEVTAAVRTLGREGRLRAQGVLLDATGDAPEGQSLDGLTQQLLNEAAGSVAVMAAAPMPLSTSRALLPLEVTSPSPAEQRAHWAAALGVSEEQPLLAQLGDQFRLSLDRIATLAREARLALPGNASHASRVERAWETARTANRRLMGGLAERVATRATWDDLILPVSEGNVLRQIAAHVRHRSQVYEQLGLARPGRGRAITVLFSGPSGTGKTLSAEVLAQDLQLDLYRIDLSSTVSKYIGETEKNLRKIFDAADQGGCILLFDEADSVFGKRGEVRDSNDRYANIQVNYLLQRLETFNGLAVLTTNLESSMDVAFMRRIQFVLNFRAPQPAERERLWRLAFPPALDSTGVDFRALSQADVSGGNIRSVAMNAVFMAVSRGESLSQEIVTEALHLEYRKLGRLVL
ncbi:ATP-binding protein [Deinococcus navajonensis]|uniref:ATP-binding protein n=1 Tax=Deinococcus navajonensis TaxID=309884 RepID=A0ABV8XTI7_9DEIO